MTTKEYIEFYINVGHKMLKTRNCYWLLSKDGYAHSFPALESVFPTDNDFNEVFKYGNKFLLFRTEIPEFNTFEYIFKGDSYNLELFDSKTRNQIRKGLKSCEIKEPDLNILKLQGLHLNQDTLRRQNRSVDYLANRELWEDYINHFFNKKDISIRSAFVDNELAGYSIFIKVINKYIILHPFRNEKYSSANPMNAILFSFINEIINLEGSIEITYGLASFSDQPGLDKFKKAMLFSEKEASRLAVVPPRYKPLFTRPIHAFVSLLGNAKFFTKYFETYSYINNSSNLFKKYY